MGTATFNSQDTKNSNIQEPTTKIMTRKLIDYTQQGRHERGFHSCEEIKDRYSSCLSTGSCCGSLSPEPTNVCDLDHSDRSTENEGVVDFFLKIPPKAQRHQHISDLRERFCCRKSLKTTNMIQCALSESSRRRNRRGSSLGSSWSSSVTS